MSPWLTLVIGVILGLLVGWVLDLVYRRRAATQPAPAPTATRQPEWAAPAPEAAAAPEVAALPAATAASVVAAAAIEESAEPVAPALAMAAEPSLEPELPAAPVEPELAAAPVATEVFEPQPEWPDVSERVAEVATELDAPAVDAPAAPHLADEIPASGAGLPPAAVAALAASEAESRDAEPVADAGARDKLILIEGIGPVYEAKLNAAGIYTFRQLIAAGDERLIAIIQPQSWQRVNFGDWVEQARLLDEGKQEELKALQARLFRRKV